MLLKLLTRKPIEDLLASHTAAGSWAEVPALRGITKRVRELILYCLKDDPSERWTASKLSDAWQKLAQTRRK